MKRMLAAAMAVAAVTSPAHARPVSYPGGWTIWLQRDDAAASALVHFTPHRGYSIGLRIEDMNAHDRQRTQAVATWLIRRWNAQHSQGNLYLRGALGQAQGHGARETAADLEAMADWETRRVFVSAGVRGLADEWERPVAEAKARVGVAPYVADFGALHTWLMLEADWKPERADRDGGPLIGRPLVRLFTGVHLFELGASTEGEVFASYILRL
jgi:hypothetical protein